MTYGKLKYVHNLEPKMGSAFHYWFVKVRGGPAEWQEEYWLVTDGEAGRFAERAKSYPRTVRLGHLHAAQEKLDLGYGTELLRVQFPSTGEVMWAITPNEMERLRRRTEKNAEDIEKNRESWLADLFD